jgi:predicted Zn-dependent protease
MKYPILLVYLSLSGLLLVTPSCSINPATGSPDLVLMSEDAEIDMGKKMHEKLLMSVPIYQDKKLSAYIQQVGKKVASQSHRPNIEYHFTIIDAADINAFALPGGYIYINRGLLAYLDSEDQLAAVLAHEIGHVTARHVVRQDTARKGASVLSIFSMLTTGSTTIGDVTNLWSTAAVKGYGREMELEADGFGAEYLFNSGYDPHAMVETIGVLKDQEKFARYRAKNEGRKTRSYHGVFSSHPRNDIRLKEVIAKAGEFPKNHSSAINNKQQYRTHIEGMVYGTNYDASIAKQEVEKNRYSHQKLGFTLLFPEQWQTAATRSAIISEPSDKSAQIKIEVAKHNKKLSPATFLRRATKATMLLRSEDFAQNGLIGHTGIMPGKNGENDRRVAVIFQGSRAYLLTGSIFKASANIDHDELFLNSIHSFSPQRSSSRKLKSKTIHYVKANEKTRIEALAKNMRIGSYAPQQIRLINGLYPRGEPKPGEWIKIIE